MTILGLSHVAISCRDIELSSAQLTSLGYSLRFDEPILENHILKSRYLHSYQPTHHIRSFSCPNAMSIELLHHGSLNGLQSSSLIPIFTGATPLTNWQSIPLAKFPLSKSSQFNIQQIFNQKLSGFYDPILELSLLWYPSANNTLGLASCIFASNSLKLAESILQRLRFQETISSYWSLLTPLPSLQANLLLADYQPTPGWSRKSLLDSPGCSCLAFMSRPNTSQSLSESFLRSSIDKFPLQVANKKLQVTLIDSPDCFTIELLEYLNDH